MNRFCVVSLFFFLILLCGPEKARADACGVTLSASNISIVWNQNFNFQAVNITVTKQKKHPCIVKLGFTRGGAVDYNRRMIYSGVALAYQIYKDAALTQTLKDLPDTSGPNESILLNFPEGTDQSTTVTYYVQIPPSAATSPAYKPAGNYQDTFSIKAYAEKADHSVDGPHVDATANVNITTSIPKILEISLVPQGASFDPAQTSRLLDFGALGNGPSSRGMDLLVRTNAGYTVSLSSQNNGKLKHFLPDMNGTIQYALTVSSTPVSLDGSSQSPVAVASGTGQTSVSGSARTLVFTTNAPAANSMAGQYSDVIIVTAATNE